MNETKKILDDDSIIKIMYSLGKKFGGDEIEFMHIARAIEAAVLSANAGKDAKKILAVIDDRLREAQSCISRVDWNAELADLRKIIEDK